MSTYIFDFDGTIADSFSLVCHILMTHASQLKCKQLNLSELMELRNLHTRDSLKRLHIPFWRITTFVRKLSAIEHQSAHEMVIFPEWLPVLTHLHQHHQIGLVSSNTLPTIEAVLKKHGMLDFFDFIHCNPALFAKKRILKKIIKKHDLNPLQTYYVGDEVRDIEAAQAAGIHAIAVNWGFNSTARLQAAQPDYLITHIDQLNSIGA